MNSESTDKLLHIKSYLTQALAAANDITDSMPAPEWDDDDYALKRKQREPFVSLTWQIEHVLNGADLILNPPKVVPKCHTCNQDLPEHMR